MKAIKITRKQAEHLTSKIYDIRYFTDLTSHMEKKYYNYGLYGWNFSIYQDNKGRYFIDSYRNAPKNLIDVDYNKLNEFQSKYYEIIRTNHEYNVKNRLIEDLINDYVDELEKIKGVK